MILFVYLFIYDGEKGVEGQRENFRRVSLMQGIDLNLGS